MCLNLSFFVSFSLSGDQVGPRDLKLTWNPCLAETAGCGRVLQAVFKPLLMKELGADILPALVLVVAAFGEGPYRASGDTLPAGFISKEQTILSDVAVFLLAGC